MGETANDYFRYIQEIVQEMETSRLPIGIFTDDIPEELQEHSEMYDELNDNVINFFAECIKQQPYGSSNPLLAEAIVFFTSKGINGQMVDKLVLPEEPRGYTWPHSILFLSLGANNEQSRLLKDFGCSLQYDRTHITTPLHRASVQLKIDHYNRIFLDKIGGKRKKTRTKQKKTRKKK
jgi:hypothetical protein